MRPVIRGDIPQLYPNQIKMDTMANLRHDAEQPPPWTFNTAAVQAALGTSTPSRFLVLLAEQWLTLNRVPQGWNLPALRGAKSQLDRRLASSGYQKAAPFLGAMLGKYCSYCEQPMAGQIAVEHCAPKSQFPFFTICWDNLLLACDACNGLTGKADNPNRQVVEGWPPVNPNDDDVALNQKILQKYLWPTNHLSYRNLVPCLTYWHNNDWQQLPDAESVRAGMTITGLDLPTRTITATIPIQGVLTPGQKVACWHSSALATAQERQQAEESVPYYGFGREGTGTGKIADCRMYNRTLTWFKAVQFFSLAAYAPAAVWPLLGSMASSTGYFSVWARVLSLMPLATLQDPTVPPNEQPRSFMGSFLKRVVEPDVFPGTNVQSVP